MLIDPKRLPVLSESSLLRYVSFSALYLAQGLPGGLLAVAVPAWLGFLVNLCASFQDVAVDGSAIDLLPEEQRARANGFMWGSKAIGRAMAAGIGSAALNTFGFSVAILIIASLLSLIILFPLFLRERPGERLLPWTSGKASALGGTLQLTNWRSIAGSLFKAASLPMSLLATVAFFILWLGEGMLFVIMPVLTVGDLGWQDTEYSQLVALSRLTSGVFGMIVGATLIERLGSTRSIF